MPEYQCGNCREASRLGPSARFCPYCGSSNLNLVIKEELPTDTGFIGSIPTDTGIGPFEEAPVDIEQL